MSRPTTRVLALLETLQDHPGMGGPELAERLGVDGRTVRRYVTKLQELGIPVEASRGRAGGYRLRPGSRLPPLMLNDDEATAVMLGLLAARHHGLSTATPAVDIALAKVHRVLPAALRERTQELCDTLGLTAGDRRMPGTRRLPPAVAAAVRGGRARAARHEAEILIDTSLEAARRRLSAKVGELERAGDRSVLLRTRAARLDGLVRLLAGLEWPFTVVGPAELRDALLEHARSLEALAGRTA